MTSSSMIWSMFPCMYIGGGFVFEDFTLDGGFVLDLVIFVCYGVSRKGFEVCFFVIRFCY